MLNKERGGGPKVVLATLASLEAGLARQLFIEWARDPKNLIIFPLEAQVPFPEPVHVAASECCSIVMYSVGARCRYEDGRELAFFSGT